ncbi:uncharacterized protein [Typha latifolia]|uniref:uncharacterized protein n=1 Tax=Typha latifolia TaxID=4733 RepID=UPI003C2F5216
MKKTKKPPPLPPSKPPISSSQSYFPFTNSLVRTKKVEPSKREPSSSSSKPSLPPSITLEENEAQFLLPTTPDSFPASSSPPSDPIPADVVHSGSSVVPKISFRGWLSSSGGDGRWDVWVRAMSVDPEFSRAWRDAGVDGAIAASARPLIPDRQAMEALFGFWCPATCTFLFPWGEAGFTLEDAHVLGCLPLTGSPVSRPSATEEEDELRLRLVVEKEKIRELDPKAKASRRVTCESWLQWFLDLRGERELKHLGFLAYWLAKDVIPPSPNGEMPARVFGLAARISRGERIPLAQVVTANIYHDLTTIASAILSRRSGRIEVWAPFGLLQAWMWERFERLQPPPSKNLAFPLSRARIIHWSKRRKTTTYEHAARVLRDGESFNWRPYSKNSGHWYQPGWYDNESQMITVINDALDVFSDFTSVVSPCALVGYFSDGPFLSEKYHPHRVARQFGFDQAVPVLSNVCALLQRVDSVRSLGAEIFVPGINRYGGVSDDYVDWWNAYIESYRKALEGYTTPVQNGVQAPKNGLMKDLVVGLGVCSFSSKVVEQREKHTGRSKCTVEKEASEGRKRKLEEISRVNNKCLEQDEEDRTDIKIDTPTSDEKKSDIVNVESEEESVDVEKMNDRLLVEELEEFLRCGLLTEWEPSSPEPEEKARRPRGAARKIEDPYGQEAIRMYPRFFDMIPQAPHYIGLLKASVDEDIRRDVYLAKWFRIVGLMKAAVTTSCHTDILEIEKLMKEAIKLQSYGFNVKHLIARLKEPQARLRRLEAATHRLEEVKKREQQAREVESLSIHINELESKLRYIEKRLGESREAIGLVHQDKPEHRADIRCLQKEVECAERNLRSMKSDVEAMNTKTEKPPS